MFSRFRNYYIQQLIQVLLYYHIAETEIPHRIHQHMLWINMALNSGLAALCGFITTYGIQGDMILSLEISACMWSVGYHLRVIKKKDNLPLIRWMCSQSKLK